MTASRGVRRKALPFGCWVVALDKGFRTPCHIWHGSVGSHGYGRWKGDLVHREAYRRLRGHIPPGLSIDHLCRQRLCVNPDHLEIVTLAENTRREVSFLIQEGRLPTGPQCGHKIEPHWKNCRICARKRRDRYKAKLKRKFGSKTVVGGLGKLDHAGLRKQREARDAKASEIAKAYVAGIPTPEIARQFGLGNRADVHRYLKLAGVKPNRNPSLKKREGE